MANWSEGPLPSYGLPAGVPVEQRCRLRGVDKDTHLYEVIEMQ